MGMDSSVPSFRDYQVQEFINSPSDYFTQYRLFTFGDVQILGGVLNVSANKKSEAERDLQSGPLMPGKNFSQGGIQIPLNISINSRPLNEKDFLIERLAKPNNHGSHQNKS